MPESIMAFSAKGATSGNRCDRSSVQKPTGSLNAGAVVPASNEDHGLACSWKVRKVTLHVHLRLLALSRSRQRNDSKHSRTDPLGDRFDRASFTGAITSLKDDADL
jgi:hypothetical protein